MAVVIRLRRTGRKNRPSYRITVSDIRFPRDGRLVETIGVYDPMARDAERQVKVDVERARHWLGNGAKPSETVTSIFKRFAVFEGLPVRKKRARPNRGRASARRTAREKASAERTARKEKRYTARVATRRAAAKAAAPAAAEA